ncbi:hypothetical protein HMPREF1316_0795 [Olsenella profusa F0195]|uniref:Uncharacterized protein n=1 Tax=Olsenella profusa F0195 TaxID=1125712 RepID=U2V001_9ACTN|nr:hypothetical protein HMPREF1316_0795 [Olsenella profusa F0195]
MRRTYAEVPRDYSSSPQTEIYDSTILDKKEERQRLSSEYQQLI